MTWDDLGILEIYWDDLRWLEMAWLEMTCDKLRWLETNWVDLKVETIWNEMRFDLKLDLKLFELSWDELNLVEMIWREMTWDDWDDLRWLKMTRDDLVSCRREPAICKFSSTSQQTPPSRRRELDFTLLHFLAEPIFLYIAILPSSMGVRGLGTFHRAWYSRNATSAHAQVLWQQQSQYSEPKVVVTWEFCSYSEWGFVLFILIAFRVG